MRFEGQLCGKSKENHFTSFPLAVDFLLRAWFVILQKEEEEE